jgi:hypothetical protein
LIRSTFLISMILYEKRLVQCPTLKKLGVKEVAFSMSYECMTRSNIVCRMRVDMW